MEPGIYNDLPDEEYHALPYASKSRLWKLRSCPEVLTEAQEVKAWLDNEDEPSYALRFGRFFDDAMCYPDSVKTKYGVGPINEKTGKSYGGDTKKFMDAEAESDKPLIALEDWHKCGKMIESIRRHPVAEPLCFGSGRWQVSLVWDDPISGVRCKGRIDRVTEWVNPAMGQTRVAHVDIKTARDVTPNIFNFDARHRGYYLQAAHYLDGTIQVTGEDRPRDFVFVVVGKEPIPGTELHDVKVFSYSLTHDAAVQEALRVRDDLLRQWAELESGKWTPRKRVHELYMNYGASKDHE